MQPETPGPTASSLPAQGRDEFGGVSEEAADGNDVGRAAGRLLGVTSFAHFLNDGVVFFVPVVGDLLAAGRHTSTAVVTAMLTIFYVTSAGFGVVVGLLADRIGRRSTMIAVGIAALGASLFGFYAALSAHGTGSSALVVVAAFIAGIGSSFYHPLGGSLLQLGFSGGSRGKALGINGAFGSLGRALYPALFFFVAALGVTKPATTAVFGGLSLLGAGIVLAGLPELVRRHDRQPPAVGAAAPRTATTTFSAVVATGPLRSELGASTWSEGLRSLLSRSVIALMAISFFRSLAFISVVSWVPIYLTTVRHAGVATTLGWSVTVMYAGGIVGQPLFGLLADRFDRRVVLALDSLGAAAGIFLFLATSGDGPSALAALATFGLFSFSGFPLLLSLVADYVPKESSTTGNALVWGIGSTGGQALGPLSASLLMAGSITHLSMAFGVLGGIVAATVLATPLLGRTARSARVALFG